MDIDARVEAWAFLHLVSGLTSRALVTLIKTFGSAAGIRSASRATLGKIVPGDLASAIQCGPDTELLDTTLRWVAESGHWLLAWDDDDFPPALLAIHDAPPMFYYAGRRELLGRPALAVVGSRNATPQGLGNAEAFASALSASGHTIVSGLATGIDAAAHRGGLGGPGSSIAVIGTGPDRVYPASNRDLSGRLAKEGGILSEFALGTPPLPLNFPRRNRLISGLSRGVLVVEATLQSGSLITARLAVEQGREVFAIPGSIHSPFSKGSHRLIREGAKLVETAQDVLEELDTSVTASPARVPAPPPGDHGAPVAAEAAQVLDALSYDPADIDALIERTGFPAERVTVALVELELAGRVAALPGGAFQRRG